jgi:signal transduction histidine kinase
MISDSKKRLLMSQVQLDHNRLLSLINNMTEGFLAVNESGQIEINNGVALDILDTNSLSEKQLNTAMPVVDSSGTSHNLLDLAKNKAFSSRDYRLRYKDGRIANLAINVSPVKTSFGSKSHSGYVVIFSDITREKIAEEERDDFISVAGHELRTPVAIAEGSISNAIFLGQKANIPENLLKLLSSAHEQLVFLSHLINDLATISRADRLKFAELAEEFDITKLLQTVKRDYEAEAAKKSLLLGLNAENLPKIYGSRLYTQEILQNLVTNAIKYTESGSITIVAEKTAHGVDITVSDTGIGIDKDEQAKLFSKFFRSQDSRVRKESGTGLGLYVSVKLASLMGAKISAKSELNKGSSFTLHLPLSIKA